MGNSYYFMSNYPKAIESYKKALELNVGSADINLNLGNAYQEVKDYASSIKHYRRVIELDER